MNESDEARGWAAAWKQAAKHERFMRRAWEAMAQHIMQPEETIDHSVFCGISHPFWNVTADWFYRGWRRIMCQRGYHLFDEVLSDTTEHTLVCDACQLEVGIAYINQPGQAG